MSGYAPINELLTVTASAGSGKTYRIAKEFIIWCLSEAPELRVYRNILAVTFTNKATAEMKERILRALKGISTGHFEEETDSLMAEEIRTYLALSPEEFKARARAVLFKILHDYSNLSITTIDSFSYRLVSTFSHDLDLPANFEVELNFNNVLATGVDLLIEKAGIEGEEELTKVLLNFVAFQLDEEDKGLKVKGRITEAGKALEYMNRDEGVIIQEGATLEQLLAKHIELQKELKEYKTRIRKKANELAAFVKQANIDPSRSQYKILVNLMDLGAMTQLQDFVKTMSKTVINVLEGASFYFKKDMKELGPMYDPWDNELRRFLADFNEMLEEYYNRQGLTDFVVKNFLPTILLRSLAGEIEALKKSDRKLHISDFSKYIQEVVKEPTPFIYERLGERYRAFLLDEFQDTSQIQWSNMKPLIENALSQEEPNKTIVVGDAKQSIYAWRGADVNLILQLMKERKDGPYTIRTEALGMNYRSRPQVVKFNNEFFGFAAAYLQNTQHEQLYRKGAQKPNKKDPQGFVHIAPKEELHEQQVLSIIQDALARNYRPKDIAILVRNKGDSSKIQQLLQKEGIAYSTGKGNLLDEDPYVLATLCLLELICHRESDEALSLLATAVLKDEHRVLFSEVLHEQVLSFISLKIQKQDFRSFLFENFSLFQVSQQGMYEAVLEMIRRFIDKPEVSALFQTWLSRLRKFEVSQSNSVEAFLRFYWEDGGARMYNGEAAEDKILIETIHSSKGLEYPVVIVPKADWSLKPDSKDIISQELPERFAPLLKVRMKYTQLLQEFEEIETSQQGHKEAAQLAGLNMLYVALTRAENELYVLYTSVKKIDEVGSVNHILQAYTTPNGGELMLGEKLVVEKKREATIPEIPAFTNEGWKSRIFVSWQATNSLEEEGINAREWGKLVHGVLAKAENAEQVRELVAELGRAGTLNEADANALEESALAFLEHEAFKPYWSLPGKRISERELVSGDKRILRPDKVIEHEGRYTIIDFKTGERNEKHRAQMDEYGRALSSISSEPCLKVLMYLRSQEVVDWE